MPSFLAKNRFVEFDYIDADGVITRRRANIGRCYRSSGDTTWLMECFCHLRRGTRHFRSDRVRNLLDGRAEWRLVPDVNVWLEDLWLESTKAAKLPTGLRIKTPPQVLDETTDMVEEAVAALLSEHFHALRALMYVAKADKFFRAPERRLFALFFSRVASLSTRLGGVQERCIKLALELDPPTAGQFHFSVRQVSGQARPYRMAVCATAKAMINTDKKVSAHEAEVFDYIIKKLRPLDE